MSVLAIAALAALVAAGEPPAGATAGPAGERCERMQDAGAPQPDHGEAAPASARPPEAPADPDAGVVENLELLEKLELLDRLELFDPQGD